MLNIFLNIGAGGKMMGTRHFGQFAAEEHDYVIFNMDSGHEQVSQILQGRGKTPPEIKALFSNGQPLASLVATFTQEERAKYDAGPRNPDVSSNFEYGTAECIMLQDATVEMIFSISPYGYKPLNLETHRVLKRDGIVIVGGTKNNPFSKTPKTEDSVNLFALLEHFPPQVKAILEKMGSANTHNGQLKGMEYAAYIKV